jgi:HAD superfamily hydrolase (TIGR01509 family)
MAIKAFIFDCGGVLLRDKNDGAYETWARRFGLTPAQLREQLWHGETWTSAELGRISEAEFWDRAGRELGLTAAEEIAALADDLWGAWQVDEAVLALVDRLRQTHRLAILSNATDALEGMLAGRYGVADRFEVILSSARLGLAKPDPAVFGRALAALGLEAGEVVFVDDRAENIAAAAALGLHVAWFVGAAELQRQLDTHLAPAVR